MLGTISVEKECKVPASEAWKLYGTLQLLKIVVEALPHFFSKYDVVQGDGGAGTIVEIFFPPGMENGLKSYKEAFKVVDEEKRVKIVEVVEGGYLDLGFTSYRITVEIIEKEKNKNECIVKTKIEYELKEEGYDNAALVSVKVLVDITKLAADYLHQNYNNNNN